MICCNDRSVVHIRGAICRSISKPWIIDQFNIAVSKSPLVNPRRETVLSSLQLGLLSETLASLSSLFHDYGNRTAAWQTAAISKQSQIQRLRQEGLSLRQIARKTGLGYGIVRRVLSSAEARIEVSRPRDSNISHDPPPDERSSHTGKFPR